MNPYLEFLNMIQSKQKVSGTLVSIENGTALVSTQQGSVRVGILTSTKLTKDDTVSIRNGQIVGKLKNENDITHYIV